jgi:hypothetical protein
MRSEGLPLTELPGPRRFFTRVSNAVDDGRNVILVIPRFALSSTLAEEIRTGIHSARCVNASLREATLRRCDGSIPEAAALAAEFIEPLDYSGHHNRWQAYLNHPESGGKSIMVAAWDADLAEDISYWLRLVHGSSLDPESRPVFVFLVRDSDVDIDALAKEHAPHLSVFWWWDVIGMLDSELCADLALTGERITPLRRAMLAESIGWEIQLAPRCAKMWGAYDAPSLLIKALRENAGGPEFKPNPEELRALKDGMKTDIPPVPLREAWNDGHINAWEGKLLPSVRHAEFEHIAERRFWGAQARILMPYLESQRQRFAERFEKLASPGDVREVSGESGLLELGRMLYAHHRRRVDFGSTDEEILKILVLARNKIAHHKSLGDDLYAAVSDICG